MEKGLISIDRWGKGSQAYFLTHLHADHTNGLSSRWSRGPLFCSPVTARLLPSRFPGFDLSLLRVLEVGATRPVSLLSPTTGSEVRVLVTPIDAHHCPGAVMYLFRGELGCVLYTGDFRWELTSERAQLGKKRLLGALGGDKVDVLYLDNTYCNPSFSFPPRVVAAQQVVDIISLHPEHEIIIGLDTLGKEDLLLHISRALKTKIWVWPERLQTVHLLGLDDVFTTKTCLTRIRAVPRYSLTLETLEALNSIHPTIGIMPSGLPWGVKPSGSNGSLHSSLMGCYKGKKSADSRIQLDSDQIYHPRRLHHYAYSVPYSEHSCFSEIEEFIKIIQPSTITRTVSSSFCDISPRYYFGHLCGLDRGEIGKSKVLSNEPPENLSGTAEEVQAKSSRAVLMREKRSRLKTNKRGIDVARLSVLRSRVCVLRRDRRGAKIAEADVICSSDVNVKMHSL